MEAINDGAAWIAGDEIDPRHQSPSHGIVYPTSPAPRLVAVRENSEEKPVVDSPRISSLDAIIDTGPSAAPEVSESEKRDGITKRLKIPSWDDIMFGGSKGTSEEE